MASKKLGHGISFYFILYTVAMISVFVITMERDMLLEKVQEDMAHLVELYVKPLEMSAYVDTARFFVNVTQSVTSDPLTIRSKSDGPVEKGDIQYSLIEAWRYGPDGSRESLDPDKVTLKNVEGDGVLTCAPVPAGVYSFLVAGYKPRIITEGRTMKLRIKDTTYVVQYNERLRRVDRDTTVLLARVDRTGIVPPQLVVSVPEPQDFWVLGVAYRKKIFIGGAENIGGIALTTSAPGRIERPPEGGSFVTFVWDQPSLGQRSFSVAADARRGFGEKDRASVSFSVDVRPPTFVTQPAEKGFWGIPYVFDGQITGLNPLDLQVQAYRDGQLLHTKPVAPKDTVVAERNSGSLQFKVLYRDAVIREHRVTLAAPPPPQIKWVRQELDRARNAFIITVQASDPVGGAVRVSMESQPSGIARLDKIQGTSFTITVNIADKPNAVYVRLTATDQYGGRSVSPKQFNIPQ